MRTIAVSDMSDIDLLPTREPMRPRTARRFRRPTERG